MGGSPQAFNLVHGYSDTDEDEAANNQMEDSMEDIIQTSTHVDDDQQHSPTNGIISLFGGHRPEPTPCDQHHGGQSSFDPFPAGFSEDEGEDGGFDRIFPGPKIKKTPLKQKSPKGKKSPRREDDEGSEDSRKAKKARKSLFGKSPFEQFDDDADEESEESLKSKKARPSLFRKGSFNQSDEADDESAQKSLRHSVRKRMSSLNLTQEDGEEDDPEGRKKEGGPSKVSFNFGLGVGSSDRGSPAPSEQSSGFIDTSRLPAVDETPYELRKNIDRQIKSTWLDIDKSGNYDPEEEAKQKAAKLNKAKARKKKAKQQAASKERRLKCIVRLHFKAIGNVVNIMDSHENWPDDWSIIDTEDERERQELRAFFRQNTPGVQPQVPIPDPFEEYEDLTGHPVARGCKDCRKHDQECSMVKMGIWPCDQCAEDDISCHPIIEPKTKGKCQRCEDLSEEHFCSFEDLGEDQQAICEQCLDTEYVDCVAGPAPGYKPDRVDLDEILYGPGRKWLHCTYCRQHKKRCSLKKKLDRPPCSHCKRHKIACTFYEVPRVETPKKEGKKKVAFRSEQGESSKDGAKGSAATTPGSDLFSAADLEDLEIEEEVEIVREVTPEIEMEDMKGHRGVLTRISTSFAHPIQFKFIDDNIPDCNFCEMPIFGMVGHFEREVHVLRWHNGLGYTEMGGGYTEEKGKSTMCQQCTIGRVQIIHCPSHDIQPIQDEGTAFDFESTFNELLEAQPGSSEMNHQLQRWCSMCFSVATFQCASAQPSLFADDDETAMVKGCGLRLCGTCETRFREEFEGDCDAMAAALDKEPKAKEGEDTDGGAVVVRADVGLLKRDGLLIRNVENETGPMEME